MCMSRKMRNQEAKKNMFISLCSCHLYLHIYSWASIFQLVRHIASAGNSYYWSCLICSLYIPFVTHTLLFLTYTCLQFAGITVKNNCCLIAHLSNSNYNYGNYRKFFLKEINCNLQQTLILLRFFDIKSKDFSPLSQKFAHFASYTHLAGSLGTRVHMFTAAATQGI